MPSYHSKPRSSSSTTTTTSSKYRTMLDYLNDNSQARENRVMLAKWMIDMGVDAAADHAEVAGIFGRKPGAQLPPVEKPVVGVDGCDEDNKAEFTKMYVADVAKRKKVMLSLYSFILGSLTDAAMSRLKNSNLWIAEDLKVADGNKVHTLLKAINAAFFEGEGENAERAEVEALREVLNPKQGADQPLTDFFEGFDVSVDNAKEKASYEMPAKLQVVALLDGLNDRFDPHRQEIIRATTITGAGYPANVAKLRESIFRIDSTMKGSTAFSVDAGSGKRPPAKTGQHTKEQADRYIDKLKREIKNLTEDAKKLREENKKLKSRTTGGEREDKRKADGKSDDKRGDKRGGDRRDEDRRGGGGGKKPKGYEQRSREPGAGGKNKPIIDANAADADHSGSDSDYDSDSE